MPRLPRPSSDSTRLAVLLLAAGLAGLGSGCSATRGARLRPAAGTKVTTMVGDQVAPPVIGTPGDQVASAIDDAPDRLRNPRARISGRVVDEQGRGVTGAVVRLADGPSRAGRDQVATTDEAGGFTLDGLRPGSDYYLIAEAEFADPRGLMVGRTRAETAARGIKIQLGRNTDSRSPDAAAAALADAEPDNRSSRRRPPSDRDDPAPDWGRPGADGASPRSTGRAEPDDDLERASGWRATSAAEPTRPGRSSPSPPRLDEAIDPDDRIDLDSEPRDRSTRSPARRVPADSADPSNPLPMSVLPPSQGGQPEAPADGDSAVRRSPRRFPPARSSPPIPQPEVDDSSSPEMPARDAPTGQRAASVGGSASVDSAETGATEPPPLPDIAQAGVLESPSDPAAPVAAPSDALIGAEGTLAASAGAAPATVAATEPFAGADAAPSAAGSPLLASAGNPGLVASGPNPADTATYDPFALMHIPRRVPGTAPAVGSTTVTAPAAASPAVRNPEPTVAALPAPASNAAAAAAAAVEPADPVPATAKPMTWGDLAGTVGTAGPAGTGAPASGPTPARAPGSARPQPSPAATRTGFFQSRRARGANPNAGVVVPTCDFDTKTNRLKDFQLPGVDDRPVRFRDLDADLVLVDFWGTWCSLCIESIPHLVALQKQYGPKRLRVVGVACENGPPHRRAAAVNKATQALGINYAVLVTSHDGTCPLQNALDVQYFPTMVLLDRAGRVVWRGVGNTPDNRSKLDRAIAQAAGEPAATSTAATPTSPATTLGDRLARR